MIKKFKGGITYIADSIKDLKANDNYNMGDECIVIETGEHYVYNSQKKWCLEPSAGSADVNVYALPDSEKDTMKEEVKAAIEAESKEDIIKAQADIKAMADRAPALNGKFGIKLESKEGKTLIEKIDELHSGLYTVYVQKGIADNPKWADADSSLRGIVHLTNSHNDSSTQKDYGWVMLMDKKNNLFVRHVYRGEWSEWERFVKYDKVEDMEQRIAKIERELLTLL